MPSNYVIRYKFKIVFYLLVELTLLSLRNGYFKIYSYCLKVYFVQCCIVTSAFLWIVFTLCIFFYPLNFTCSVLVCLDCRDKKAQTKWLKQQAFSHSSAGFKFKSRGLARLVSTEISLVPCRPLPCVLT